MEEPYYSYRNFVGFSLRDLPYRGVVIPGPTWDLSCGDNLGPSGFLYLAVCWASELPWRVEPEIGATDLQLDKSIVFNQRQTFSDILCGISQNSECWADLDLELEGNLSSQHHQRRTHRCSSKVLSYLSLYVLIQLYLCLCGCISDMCVGKFLSE